MLPEAKDRPMGPFSLLGLWTAAVLATAEPQAVGPRAPVVAATPIPVSLPAQSRLRIEIERTFDETRDGVTKREVGTLTYDADLIRLSDGYEARWRLIASTGTVHHAIPLQSSVPYAFRADAGLKPKDWLNWPEVRDAIQAVIQSQEATGRDSHGAIMGLFSADNRPVPATAVMSDANLISAGQGTNLRLGVPDTYESQTPNPLGGQPVTLRGSFTLESFDAGAGRATVLWRSRLDPESATRSVTETMSDVTSDDPEAAAELRGLKLERQDECRYQIDLPTGLAIETTCTTRYEARTPAAHLLRIETMRATQSLLPLMRP